MQKICPAPLLKCPWSREHSLLPLILKDLFMSLESTAVDRSKISSPSSFPACTNFVIYPSYQFPAPPNFSLIEVIIPFEIFKIDARSLMLSEINTIRFLILRRYILYYSSYIKNQFYTLPNTDKNKKKKKNFLASKKYTFYDFSKYSNLTCHGQCSFILCEHSLEIHCKKSWISYSIFGTIPVQDFRVWFQKITAWKNITTLCWFPTSLLDIVWCLGFEFNYWQTCH